MNAHSLTDTVPSVKHEVLNAQRDRLLEPFRKARIVFENKTQWANGETVELYNGTLNGKSAKLWLKNESGKISLQLFVDNERMTRRFYSKPLLFGLMTPDQGWTLSTEATESKYLNWNSRTRREMA